jgi:recombinational DNA repair ATPase RecF
VVWWSGGIQHKIERYNKSYIGNNPIHTMDYSYRMPRLFNDVDQLRERQKKLERYIEFLQKKRNETIEKLEKKVAEQEKIIERLKERTELMAKDSMRLKEKVNKLTELVEYLANKQKREERLDSTV